MAIPHAVLVITDCSTPTLAAKATRGRLPRIDYSGNIAPTTSEEKGSIGFP
jgi:hypothetical protein